jgi:hypothetical protein
MTGVRRPGHAAELMWSDFLDLFGADPFGWFLVGSVLFLPVLATGAMTSRRLPGGCALGCWPAALLLWYGFRVFPPGTGSGPALMAPIAGLLLLSWLILAAALVAPMVRGLRRQP